jgi:AdoMet dependent proline di-methyltransferase
MIDDFKDRISGFNTAIDMGAGIGRISKATLIPRFKEVDLVEPAEI